MFRCTICGQEYDTQTQDGCCNKGLDCYGVPLVEVSASRSPAKGETIPVGASPSVIEGLCILVCDASGSMYDPAFPPHPITKLKLVAGAVQKAIAELSGISKRESAYIAIIAFAERAVLVKDSHGGAFIKSVAQIQNEFGNTLGDYLEKYFLGENDLGQGYTDITTALNLAKRLYDDVLAGDIKRWGVNNAISLIGQAPMHTSDGRDIHVPNVRVVIYSDGSHNAPNGGPLSNPFSSVETSPLLTAFIGNEALDSSTLQGANDMKNIATVCPIHNQKGYSLINNAERHAVLYRLFRMASGTSGLCWQCLKDSGGFIQ